MTSLTYKQKFNKRHNQPLNKSNSLQEISKLSGVKLSAIKKIVEKGKGAYYSNPQSVRKQVKSASQWGRARLYASLSPGSKSSKIDAKELKAGRKKSK